MSQETTRSKILEWLTRGSLPNEAIDSVIDYLSANPDVEIYTRLRVLLKQRLDLSQLDLERYSEIIEWLRKAVPSNFEPLTVYIDPGNASEELLTEFFVALASVYRAYGGSGLEIVSDERRSFAGELAQ